MHARAHTHRRARAHTHTHTYSYKQQFAVFLFMLIPLHCIFRQIVNPCNTHTHARTHTQTHTATNNSLLLFFPCSYLSKPLLGFFGWVSLVHKLEEFQLSETILLFTQNVEFLSDEFHGLFTLLLLLVFFRLYLLLLVPLDRASCKLVPLCRQRKTRTCKIRKQAQHSTAQHSTAQHSTEQSS